MFRQSGYSDLLSSHLYSSCSCKVLFHLATVRSTDPSWKPKQLAFVAMAEAVSTARLVDGRAGGCCTTVSVSDGDGVSSSSQAADVFRSSAIAPAVAVRNVVPPPTVRSTEPLASPLQRASVAEAEAVSTGGSFTVALAVAVQPLASVTVTV